MSFNSFHNLPELARNGGFTLCEGTEEKDITIDWRFIASIDTTRIIRESDFEKLDQCIPFLIRSSVGNLLNVRILDPAIARIYILSQLCLQYLLFCTKFLDKSVYSLRENIFENQKKSLKLEEVIEKRDGEIAHLQKKLKRQDVLNQPVFSCQKCTKNFLSQTLLDNHILRKHPLTPQQESKDKDSNLINTIKLELEIKQLKERLNASEKELMDVNLESKKGCDKCYENSRKNFQSVAVQSNFEEKEKDDIEKDAISELLNNQMKHFEEWKHNEEMRYRSEIIELKTKLDETIEMLKDVASHKEALTPSPAPRLRIISEKSVGTSESIGLLTKPVSEEIVWKSRFEELEKKYEEHQQRMSSTVTSIQKTYNEKMSNIEETVKKLQDERVTLQNEVAIQLDKPKQPLSPKIIKKVFADESSSSCDSIHQEPLKEVQPKLSDMKFAKLDVAREPVKSSIEISPSPEKSEIIMKTYSNQKFLNYPKKTKQLKKDSPKLLKTLREQADELFNERLNGLGIAKNKERMSKEEFNRVHSHLAKIRDTNKKKNKSFFVTRKELQSKVEKIFHRKNERANDKISNVIEKAYHNDNDVMVVKSAPVETVTTENIDSINQSFRSDLERMLKKKFDEQSQSVIHQQLPIQQVPVPRREVVQPSKKKVMFAAEEEDDSDFDLSSFPSEAEEPRVRAFM